MRALPVKVQVFSDIIHNGANYDKPEHKAPLSTRERAQLITYANRVSRGYMKDGIPLMLPPNQLSRVNEPRALLLECVIVDAHDCHGPYEALWLRKIAWACYTRPCRVAL